jgi:hypothetical protein
MTVKNRFSLLTACVICASHIAAAEGKDFIALDKYTCAEFLNDVEKPSDGEKMMRSLMMISWATGYAAAINKISARADAVAINLTAVVLGEACRKAPADTAVHAVTEAIKNFRNPQ